MTKLDVMRRLRGMTQKALADATGISLRTLQHYEQGARPFDGAKIGTILSVCIALRCSLEDIIEDQEILQQIKEYKEIYDAH